MKNFIQDHIIENDFTIYVLVLVTIIGTLIYSDLDQDKINCRLAAGIGYETKNSGVICLVKYNDDWYYYDTVKHLLINKVVDEKGKKVENGSG